MSIKQLLSHLLDRRGGRTTLELLSNLYLHHCLGLDFQITYQHMWAHRINGYYFPHGQRYDYSLYSVLKLIREDTQRRANSEDFWFPFCRPEKGEVIIDVGAGRGEDLPAFLQAVGTTGKIIAIEAHPRSFSHLKQFCWFNKLTNVTPLHVALMDKPGFVSLTDGDDWESNSVIAENDSVELHVPSDTLDNICEREGVGTISFIKMNIEGAERFALPGMDRTIQQCKTICVACHDFRADRGEGEHFRTRSFVEGYLAERGFEVVSRRSDARDYVRDHVFGLSKVRNPLAAELASSGSL